jgi:hypothetical protein
MEAVFEMLWMRESKGLVSPFDFATGIGDEDIQISSVILAHLAGYH